MVVGGMHCLIFLGCLLNLWKAVYLIFGKLLNPYQLSCLLPSAKGVLYNLKKRSLIDFRLIKFVGTDNHKPGVALVSLLCYQQI